MSQWIALACRRNDSPFLASDTTTRRSSASSRRRSTSPVASIRLSSGVSVPWSRRRREAMSRTVQLWCSHSTISTRYWG